MFALSDGSGMAVTIARYETPAHTDIDKVQSVSFFSELFLADCLNYTHLVLLMEYQEFPVSPISRIMESITPL